MGWASVRNRTPTPGQRNAPRQPGAAEQTRRVNKQRRPLADQSGEMKRRRPGLVEFEQLYERDFRAFVRVARAIVGDAQLIWGEVCQVRAFVWPAFAGFFVSAGGAHRPSVDACVAADMRGSGPHDRVCEVRSGAAL